MSDVKKKLKGLMIYTFILHRMCYQERWMTWKWLKDARMVHWRDTL